MILDKIITRDRIKTGLSDLDKWTVIEDLAELIAAGDEGSDRETLLNDTLKREHTESTGIGKGIAIPHARTTGVTDLIGALGTSQAGLDFEAKDGEPCHLVFLILAPAKETTRYLKALKAVACIGQDEELAARLRSAASPDEVISILGEVETCS
jgi:mannitol/fructose-specific phosphotransferase system IIA component (Ntr-type)